MHDFVVVQSCIHKKYVCVYLSLFLFSMHQWDLESYILAPLGLQNWSLVCPKIDSKSVKLAAEATSLEPSLASAYYSKIRI